MEYPLIGGAILLVAAGVAIYDHIQPEPPDATTLDGLSELHARGDISDAKYNRRRDVLLRDEQDIGTFRWFQEIDGVGPATAFRLADHFETMTDVRTADRSEFESVHNVGESIAGAIEQKRADEHPIHES
jgi:ERCC4-type nuclease